MEKYISEQLSNLNGRQSFIDQPPIPAHFSGRRREYITTLLSEDAYAHVRMVALHATRCNLATLLEAAMHEDFDEEGTLGSWGSVFGGQ